MRVHAGDTIKVEDIGTLGTVKKDRRQRKCTGRVPVPGGSGRGCYTGYDNRSCSKGVQPCTGLNLNRR